MPQTLEEQEQKLRTEIVDLGRRLYERDLVAATDGNLSARLGPDLMLATPSGVHKGMMSPEQIVKCDLSGVPVGSGEGKPSSEIRMHVLVYQARPDVAATIHAHPIHAVALSLVGVSLAECLLPEPALALGPIPTAPYATPTTPDVPESIRDFLARRFNALILARHGTLTLGQSLEQAYLRLETLEHTARITAAARSIGQTEALPPNEVQRIENIARDLGIARPAAACSLCGACGKQPVEGSISEQPDNSGFSSSQSPLSTSDPRLIDELTAAVLRRLGHDRVAEDTEK